MYVEQGSLYHVVNQTEIIGDNAVSKGNVMINNVIFHYVMKP